MSIEIKLISSIKFRGISKVFEVMEKHLSIFGLIPSHSSTILWTQKLGLYRINNCMIKAKDWILIVDESIQIGKEKLLVILGVRESEISWNGALKYTDMSPLLIKSKESWSGDEICKEMKNLKEKIGEVIYAVCDNAGNLNNALLKTGIPQIADISHTIALILKKLYEANSVFQEYLKKVSEVKNKLQQSSLSHLAPPGRRSKSQYMNLYGIILWGRRILRYLALEHDVGEKKLLEENLGFIKDYESLIVEIYEIGQAVKNLQKEVKTKGLNRKTIKTCKGFLKPLKSKNGRELRTEMNAYFQTCFSVLDEEHNLVCTSDIIESMFGKYKNFSSDNKMAGITSLALCIASITVSNVWDILKKALESVKTSDIAQWAKENIGQSVFSKRKKAFGSC